MRAIRRRAATGASRTAGTDAAIDGTLVDPQGPLLIEKDDFEAALDELRPSLGPAEAHRYKELQRSFRA